MDNELNPLWRNENTSRFLLPFKHCSRLAIFTTCPSWASVQSPSWLQPSTKSVWPWLPPEWNRIRQPVNSSIWCRSTHKKLLTSWSVVLLWKFIYLLIHICCGNLLLFKGEFVLWSRPKYQTIFYLEKTITLAFACWKSCSWVMPIEK